MSFTQYEEFDSKALNTPNFYLYLMELFDARLPDFKTVCTNLIGTVQEIIPHGIDERFWAAVKTVAASSDSDMKSKLLLESHLQLINAQDQNAVLRRSLYGSCLAAGSTIGKPCPVGDLSFLQFIADLKMALSQALKVLGESAAAQAGKMMLKRTEIGTIYNSIVQAGIDPLTEDAYEVFEKAEDNMDLQNEISANAAKDSFLTPDLTQHFDGHLLQPFVVRKFKVKNKPKETCEIGTSIHGDTVTLLKTGTMMVGEDLYLPQTYGDLVFRKHQREYLSYSVIPIRVASAHKVGQTSQINEAELNYLGKLVEGKPEPENVSGEGGPPGPGGSPGGSAGPGAPFSELVKRMMSQKAIIPGNMSLLMSQADREILESVSSQGVPDDTLYRAMLELKDLQTIVTPNRTKFVQMSNLANYVGFSPVLTDAHVRTCGDAAGLKKEQIIVDIGLLCVIFLKIGNNIENISKKVSEGAQTVINGFVTRYKLKSKGKPGPGQTSLARIALTYSVMTAAILDQGIVAPSITLPYSSDIYPRALNFSGAGSFLPMEKNYVSLHYLWLLYCEKFSKTINAKGKMEDVVMYTKLTYSSPVVPLTSRVAVCQQLGVLPPDLDVEVDQDTSYPKLCTEMQALFRYIKTWCESGKPAEGSEVAQAIGGGININ